VAGCGRVTGSAYSIENRSPNLRRSPAKRSPPPAGGGEAQRQPDFLPPRLEAPGEFAIAAARDLLMPFLRRPSYCLSSYTLGPWPLAISLPFRFE
jgi:hypothetical protein